MTGQRGPHQAVAAPTNTIATAAATAAARQGAPGHDHLAGPGDDDLVHGAAGGRAARRRAAQRAAQGAGAGRGEDGRIPQASQDGHRRGRAEHGPQDTTARLSADLVAITAARQASAASASALASGTSCCPVTAMSWRAAAGAG